MSRSQSGPGLADGGATAMLRSLPSGFVLPTVRSSASAENLTRSGDASGSDSRVHRTEQLQRYVQRFTQFMELMSDMCHDADKVVAPEKAFSHLEKQFKELARERARVEEEKGGEAISSLLNKLRIEVEFFFVFLKVEHATIRRCNIEAATYVRRAKDLLHDYKCILCPEVVKQGRSKRLQAIEKAFEYSV